MRNSSLERRQSAVSHFVDPGTASWPLQARPFDPSRFTRTSTPSANRASTPAPAAVSWTPPPTLNRYANGGSAGRTPISAYQPANAPGSCTWTWTPTTGEPGGPRGSTQRAAPGDDHIPNRTRRYAACLPIPCRLSPIRISAGQLGRGLDVRGEGGYVVVPPSRTEGCTSCWSAAP
jgi:hypothetical protein